MPTQQLALSLVLALMVFSGALELKVDDFRRVATTPKAVICGLIAQFILLPVGTWLATLVLDRRAVMIEGGMQNSGLALGIIALQFNPDLGMVIIASLWGIWHIVSSMSLGLLWRRRHARTVNVAKKQTISFSLKEPAHWGIRRKIRILDFYANTTLAQVPSGLEAKVDSKTSPARRAPTRDWWESESKPWLTGRSLPSG